MFREMRRFKQELSREDAEDILYRNTSGTLALMGDDGYPYSLPMSYLYTHGNLYFHSAKTGHKIDAIRRCEKASFSVIDLDRVVPEAYTTHFRSVIAFGTARLIETPEEMRPIAAALGMKYSAPFAQGIPAEIDSSIANMVIIELKVQHLTGKEAIELVRARK